LRSSPGLIDTLGTVKAHLHDQTPTFRRRLVAVLTSQQARSFTILTVVGGLLTVTALGPFSVVTQAAPLPPMDAELTQELTLDTAELAKLRRDEYKVVNSNTVVLGLNAPAPDLGSAQAYAQERLLAMGFGSGEYACLYSLWMKESRWNYRAQNPSSGAYGIPQALPGSKMASAGADWRTNAKTQVRWGLSYIKGRYGSPCAAWNHSKAKGWY